MILSWNFLAECSNAAPSRQIGVGWPLQDQNTRPLLEPQVLDQGVHQHPVARDDMQHDAAGRPLHAGSRPVLSRSTG